MLFSKVSRLLLLNKKYKKVNHGFGFGWLRLAWSRSCFNNCGTEPEAESKAEAVVSKGAYETSRSYTV